MCHHQWVRSFCYWQIPTPEPEVELTEADLPDLQESVTRLIKEYDDAVVVKHNLENDVRSCSERLKAATGLLHRYVILVPRYSRSTGEKIWVQDYRYICSGNSCYKCVSCSTTIELLHQGCSADASCLKFVGVFERQRERLRASII